MQNATSPPALAKTTKRALVTGASSGIGAALGRRLAQTGYEVWLAARRTELLLQEVAAIEAAGGRAHAFPLDVADARKTEASVIALDESVGLDLVVANAGVGGGDQRLLQTSLDEARAIFDINLTGALATLMPMMSRMAARRAGHLVAVSSLAGEIPTPVGVPYGASKAALSYFMDGARVELATYGVAVTLVHPGFVKTPMTEKARFPMPFLLELDDAVAIIERGIAKRSALVRFPFGLTSLMALGKAAPRALRNRVMARATLR